MLKVKIDSFDTKREQSPISHFHGNNLYTTSREHNNFSFFQYVEHNSVKNLASDSLCLSWDDVVAINTEQKRGQEILPQ